MFAGKARGEQSFEPNLGEVTTMADDTTTTPTPTTPSAAVSTPPVTAKKPAASVRTPRVAAKKPAARKRKPVARTAGVTSPSRSTGRRVRTQARNETREAAQANLRAARTTAQQGRSLVERAALTYVGATLEARDRVIGTAATVADTFGTREKAVRELEKLQARYERRGTTSRNQLERDVKKARTRLERVVRRNRQEAEKDATRGVDAVTGRVISATQKVGSLAKERISALA
jgi:hypothetical protein